MGVKVSARQCGSCIFGPNSAIRFTPERMRELVRAWRAQDTFQVCHAFGHGATDDEGNEVLVGENVICRGFFDNEYAKRGTGQLLRIAERINCVEFVEPPATPFGMEAADDVDIEFPVEP